MMQAEIEPVSLWGQQLFLFVIPTAHWESLSQLRFSQWLQIIAFISSAANKLITSRGRKWIRNSICLLYNLVLSSLLDVKKEMREKWWKPSVHPTKMANS